MLEAAAFLLLGLSIISAILYLLHIVARLTSLVIEMQGNLINVANESSLLRENLDTTVEAMTYEIDALRKRCDMMEM